MKNTKKKKIAEWECDLELFYTFSYRFAVDATSVAKACPPSWCFLYIEWVLFESPLSLLFRI